MCLSTVTTPLGKIPMKDRRRIDRCYKIIWHPKDTRRYAFDCQPRQQLRGGKWLRAIAPLVKTPHSESYLAGFHAYEKLVDATRICKETHWTNSCVVAVEMRGLLAIGQQSDCTVRVYRYMRMARKPRILSRGII